MKTLQEQRTDSVLKMQERITELEQENAELKDYNKKLLQSDIDKQNKIVLLSKKVNDLQKKNAELKEKLEIEQNARGDWFGKAVTKDRRLNEAKEIIRELVDRLNGFVGHHFLIVDEAVAFLKE